MLTVQQIADSVSVASREYPLRKVELFGSYASGKNTPQSDVDLLVEFAQPRVSLLDQRVEVPHGGIAWNRCGYHSRPAAGRQYAGGRQEDSTVTRLSAWRMFTKPSRRTFRH